MGREIGLNRTPVLDSAEQNIGNSALVQPQPGAVGDATVIPQTNPPRILNLTGGSPMGQTISVTMTASRVLGEQNPNPGLPGPITGVIQFGNGGRDTRIEFDVPIGPFAGSLSQATEAIEPQDGGVIVTVPSGVLRVYARYDNLLLSPVLGFNQPLHQIAGVAAMGPGGPRPNGGGAPPTPAEPLLVKAMAAYFTRHYSKAYKTDYLYVPVPLVPVSIVVGVPATSTFRFFCLPAFAQNVKVLRLPLTSALEVQLSDGVQIVDQYSIAAGTSAPIIPIQGHVCVIGIRSLTVGDTVSFLALQCEVGI